MSGELPEGWAATTLGELTSPSSAKVEPNAIQNVRYLSLEHLESNTNRIIAHGNSSEVRSTKTVFRNGDVLYGKLRPYLNKVAVPDFDGICSTDILVFPKSPHLESRFFMWFLSQRAVVAFANHNSSGIQLPRTSFTELAPLELPLPPLAEQRRVVAKLEQLVVKVNAIRQRLDHVQTIVDRFRRSVFAAACLGQLTADWRRDNPNIGSVAAALSKANEFRGAHVKAANDTCGSKRFRYAPAADIEIGRGTKGIDELVQLPDTWEWSSLGQLTWSVADGPHFSPKYVKPNEGVPFISGRNISFRGIDFSDAKYVSRQDHEVFSRRAGVRVGDVLLTKGGTTGIATVVTETREFSVWVHVAVLKIVNELVTPWYLRLALAAPFVYAQSQAQTHGVGNQDLGLTRLVHMALPLPPIEEQREIAQRVDKLLFVADRIQTRLNDVSSGAYGLVPSLLDKAFRGELVPTEAELAKREGREYEPASVLLERIRRDQMTGEESDELPVKRKARRKSA